MQQDRVFPRYEALDFDSIPYGRIGPILLKSFASQQRLDGPSAYISA